MIRPARLLLVAILLALSGRVTLGQVQTGTPPFGSYAPTGPDTVNLGNLNTHLQIPVLHKPGRGLNFNFDLAYDSSVWMPDTLNGATSWNPVGAWGWSSSAFKTGTVTNSETITHGTCTDQHGLQHNSTTYTWAGWAYIDSFGTRHRFGSTSGHIDGCTISSYGFTLTALDGSGYTMTTLGASVTQLTGPDGALITPTNNVGSGGGGAQDRNGNQITYASATGVFTDTLGTTALTIAGAAPNPVTYTYQAPSGSNVSFTVKFTTYSVRTNFGCTNVGDYGTNGTTTANLVSEIDLPDGSKYSFSYEPTPGYSGFVTGRLASVTLPTGGPISYGYSGGNNGINCIDGSTAILARTTSDGTWTYAHSQISGSHWQTKVTTPFDPQNPGSVGNDTVIDFQQDAQVTGNTTNTFETQRLAYQGSSSSGTLLRTTLICYNGNASNCTTTAVSTPLTQRNVTITLPGAKNLQSQSIYKYNSTGSLTEQDDYDYGSGAVGSLLKKTVITPNTSLGNSITAFRSQVVVYNGALTLVSQTNYNYDETAVASTTSTPQHASVSGSRGNLTSINFYTSGSTYLTKRMSYYDTGMVQTVTDVNGAQATYTTTTCGNSFPTSVSEPLSLSKSMTWNCTGGAQLTLQDENSQTTTTGYTDPYFWRPASVTDPTTAVANLTYTGQTQAETVLNFNGTSSTSDALTTLDTYGRSHVSQTREVPNGSNYDSVETDYDGMGRVSRVTVPYVGLEGETNFFVPYSTGTYDALNRQLQVTDAATGYRSWSYSQNDVYVTRGPAPTGENAKRRQEEFDALGRLTSVCEVTSGTGSGSCAQNTTQTGFWTKYSYDALGRITGVTQNAQSGSTQTRTYFYDLMGRMTSETNPENGTTTYVYDTDATCGTSNGDLVKKTDAVGNVICTTYDALHRPTTVTYPSGAYASLTPAKAFVYDSATVNGVAMSNAKGRLAEAYTYGSLTIQNPGFESSGTLPPPGWSASNSTLSYDTTTQYAGARSLKVAASALYGSALSPTQAGAAGKLYTISGYAKSDGTCYADIQLMFLNSSNGYLGGAQAFAGTTTSWTFISATANAPSGTAYVQISLQNNTTGGAGVCEFDNISGTTNAGYTDEGFSYTVRGEVSDFYQSTPNSSGYYHLTQAYWANGAPKQLSGLPTLATISFGVDGKGRVATVSASAGQNPVTATTYNTAGSPTSVTLGSSDNDAYQYDPNTNRMTQYQFNVGSQSITGALTWNANGSLQTLAITDPVDTADAQTCNYLYDDFVRISSANCGSAAAQTFSYDAFGNLTKSGSPKNFQPLYNPATNRITSVGNFTPTYDANGNPTNDSFNTYSWDADGHTINLDGMTFTYDALGRWVERNNGGTISQVVYTPTGAKLGYMLGQTFVRAFIPMPNGASAVFDSSTSGQIYFYRHADWLGSARAASSTTRAFTSVTAYAPFGETYASQGGDINFTGMESANVTGIYEFPAREYDTQGRWYAPDPSGLSAVSLSDPQTLNRYAYVRNNPLGMVDPNGLCGEAADDDAEYDCGGGGGGDGGGGGVGGGDPTAGGDPGNSGSNCDASQVSCGGNTNFPYYGRGPAFGGNTIVGNDIFDAIDGAPGTYLTLDSHGNTSFGFSIGLWQATWAFIEEANGTGNPYGYTTSYNLGPSHFNVLVDTGSNITTGFIPELIEAALQGAKDAGSLPTRPSDFSEARSFRIRVEEAGLDSIEATEWMVIAFPDVADFFSSLSAWYAIYSRPTLPVLTKYSGLIH